MANSTLLFGSYVLGPVIARDRGHVLTWATVAGDDRRVWLKFAESQDGESESGTVAAELRREAEITSSLNSTRLLTLLEVREEPCGPVLVYEPFAGTPLAETLTAQAHSQQLDTLGKIRVARAISEAVAELHGLRVVHKYLSPISVLLNGESARLSNLGRATRMRGKSRETAAMAREFSEMPYLSPEQTGRLNWGVGFSSDLYSLGIILYELFTGCLPFAANDVLEWVHCHIARTPVPPAQVDPGIPASISAIVVRLLAKNPADRYLSASGLLADLRRAEETYVPQLSGTQGSAGEPFSLGESDRSEQFQLPERIYGRDKELEVLSAALARAAAGATELITVAGPPGAGKSTLIHEWHGTLNGGRGGGPNLFGAGKFEQAQRDQPYFGLRRAIQSVCRYLSCESEGRAAEWRARLNQALGNIGGVMTASFPALIPILGEQPEVPDLPPAETLNRFNEAFRKLIGALAAPERPLVLFLDDVQWADGSSLGLIASLLTAPDCGGLMVILGFRDQDRADVRQIERTLSDLAAKNIPWNALNVSPLSASDISAMLSDAMASPAEHFDSLAELVGEKTGGNPFFVRQFLLQLADEDMIFYDRGWHWAEETVRQARITDNVVEFVANQIGRLPESWRRVIEICSCFGTEIRRDLLPRLLGQSSAEITIALEGALASGALQLHGGEYAFVHDRVREAAASLVSPDRLAAVHLGIAEILLEQSEVEVESQLFDIVHHLEIASPLIVDPVFQLRVRELNLRAARRARSSAAYVPALEYARAACPPFGNPLWETHYEFCAQAALLFSECLFFNQKQQAFESFNLQALERLVRPEHNIALRRMMILALSASSRHEEAVASTRQALDYLADPLPADLPATFAALGEEVTLINQLIADKGIEALRSLPPIQDERSEAIVGILLSITPDTVMLGLGALYALTVARAVRITIEHGQTALVPVVFANYSVVVHQMTGDVDTAYRWARLASQLAEERGGALQAPANFIPGWLVAAWKLPAKTQIPIFDAACRSGLEQGDILFGCFSAAAATVFMAWSGAPLQRTADIAEANRQIIHGRVYSAEYHCLLERQFARALMGMTQGRISLAEPQLSLTELDAVRQTRSAHQIGYYFCTRARLCYLFGEFAEAAQWFTELEPYVPGITGLLIQADYAFYQALVILEGLAPLDEKSLQRALEQAGTLLERLANWARDCPQNFLCYELIVQAELARVQGNFAGASESLVKAIAAAEESGLVHLQALACELAVRVHLARADKIAARAYLQEAIRHYQEWGAATKVQDLTERYRSLRPAHTTGSGGAYPQENRPSLDLLSLMKCAEAISGEIVMNSLIERMMRILIESACAEWGAILLVENGGLVLKAIQRSTGIELLSQPLDEPSTNTDVLPRSLLHYVSSTEEALVLSDARRSPEFAADPVIQRTGCRSVLCAPILHNNSLCGLIYLENNLTTGAFTPDRLEFLRLLSSQIAVSIENARYHERTLEWERLQRDLNAARAIQMSLLPQQMPDSECYSVAIRSSACYEVGGDYTDVLPQPNGEWMMVVADVAGKGLASAMVASSFRSAFRAFVGAGLPLNELANQLGELHWREGEEARRRYVTAAFLRLNLHNNTLEVVNAGHNPVILLSSDGKRKLFLASAPPLGMFSGLRYHSETVPFEPGARLLAFTDGLTEVARGEEEFGEERLFSAFERLPFTSGDLVLKDIWSELTAFSSEPGQGDDMTALVVQRSQ